MTSQARSRVGARPVSPTLVMTMIVLLVMQACVPVCGFNVYVKPNDEECYYEHVERNEKLYMRYEVQSGGYLDIDIKITGPDSSIVYEGEREKEGSLQFKGSVAGRYQICFINSMSMVYGKTLSFAVHTGHSLLTLDAAKTEHLTPLEQGLITTSEGVQALHDTQIFLKYREVRHSQTLESTKSRVFWWSLSELIALLSVSTFNVMFLRSLFDKRGNSMTNAIVTKAASGIGTTFGRAGGGFNRP